LEEGGTLTLCERGSNDGEVCRELGIEVGIPFYRIPNVKDDRFACGVRAGEDGGGSHCGGRKRIK